MAANTIPIIPLTPVVGTGVLTTANTAMNGTGTLVTLFTAGSNGARVDQITAIHLGTNVATVLRLFIQATGINGGVAFLRYEIAVAANTVSQTAASVQTNLITPGLVLPAGATIQAAIGTTVAAGLQVTVEGMSY